MVKYLAIFPGKWGDEIRRVYKNKNTAIHQAKSHLLNCQDANTSHFAEVYEFRNGQKTLIFEQEY